MEALQEFIEELGQHDVDLTSTLRKAKALTITLHSPELDEWINSELYGYSDLTKVPDYRRFSAVNYGHFTGPNEGTATDLLIPTDDLPPGVKEFAENPVMLDGIGALQAHGAEPDERSWPPDFVLSAQEATALKGGMFLTKAYQPIPASVYPDILEQVRNRLFDFLLGLQNNNRTLEESNESEAVGRLVNYHIYGDHNVIATGEQSTQQVTTNIVQNDIESLVTYLKNQGIGEDELQELRDVVLEEDIPADGSYGPKLREWREKMLEKAKSGAWNVAVDIAPKLLGNALKAFIGI